MCGASEGQKMAAASLGKISGQMSYFLEKVMGENMNILGMIKNALAPIVTGGPSQFGMSPAEEAAKRTAATANITAAGRRAADATRSALASRGGGNIYLPSGSEAAIESGLAQNIAEKQAEAQLGITEEGYKIGRENFFRGTGMLTAAPGELEGPIAQAGGAAVGAGKASSEAQEAITAANQAWMGPVGGIIGGVATKLIPGIGALGGATNPPPAGASG